MKAGKTIVSVVLLVLMGCGQKKLAPAAWVDYYHSHRDDLRLSKEMGEIRFEAELLPTEFLALRDMKNPVQEFSEGEYLLYYNSYCHQVSFLLKIEPADEGTSLKKLIPDKENYVALKQYMNQAIRNDLSLQYNTHTLPCSLVHCESDIGLHDAIHCVMSFEMTDSITGNDLTLIYNDRLFGHGPLKFNFSASQLKQFPQLTF